MAPLIQTMKADPDFGLFDYLTKEEIYQIDIGPILEQMEYEIFDSIRVSEEVPFVVMNLNRKKIQGWKSTYLSDDRRYKIYQGKESPSPHEPFLRDWSLHKKYATPYTVIIKILMQEPPFVEKIVETSYIDAVFTFGEGLYLKLKKDQATETKVARAVQIFS